jgi:hypothetical protein
MTYQSLNYGSADNDGTGEALRAAAIKIDNNFKYLYGYPTSGNANKILATPNGANGEALFRALVSNDIPATLTAKTLPSPTFSGNASGSLTNLSLIDPILQYKRRPWTGSSDTALVTDYILAFTGVVDTTLTLFTASGNVGKILVINNRSAANTLTIDPNDSETLDGALTQVIYPGQSTTIQCDGSNWVSLKEQGKGRVLLQEQIISSPVASVDFTRGITSAFNKYDFEFLDVKPATDDAFFYCRVSSNGGTSYDSGASDYNQAGSAVWSNTSFNTSTISAQNTSQGFMSPVNAGIGVSSASNEAGYSGTLSMYSPSNTSRFKQFIGTGGYNLSSDNFNIYVQTSFIRKSSSAINAIRFLFSTGNVASGVIRLYGVN